MNRDEFMELVYETFADEPDNVLANGIIEAADAYVEHEKTQLSCEGTTSDLISRQAVINAIENTNAKMSMPEWDEITNAVMSLPTIQPQSTTGQLNDGAQSTARSTDLIERQQAIDEIKNYCENGCDIAEDNWCPSCQREQFIELLKVLPSPQPEPQWIPVSERLPEDLSEVNVTWVNHNPELYYESTKDKPFTATAVYYNGEWYWYSATCVDYLEEYGRCDWNKIDEAIGIIAWMPLPEAYKPNK